MAANKTKQKIEILYEDDDVLVINKPAGLVVHSDGRTVEPTVVDWILKWYPNLKDVGDLVASSKGKVVGSKGSNESILHTTYPILPIPRSGIVHRLDRETSGALLIAKNQTAFARLKKQFQRQQVHKTYHAFVYGSVKNDEGLIDRPIARSRSNPVLWSAMRGRKGEEREAITEYKVLARFKGAPFVAKGAPLKDLTPFSFLELFPRTGRTHQLRVHFKAINYPIVCDKLYAPARVQRAGGPNRECALGFSRLALHSRALSFVHPRSGERMTIEAPYPEDFENALILSRI